MNLAFFLFKSQFWGVSRNTKTKINIFFHIFFKPKSTKHNKIFPTGSLLIWLFFHFLQCLPFACLAVYFIFVVVDLMVRVLCFTVATVIAISIFRCIAVILFIIVIVCIEIIVFVVEISHVQLCAYVCCTEDKR